MSHKFRLLFCFFMGCAAIMSAQTRVDVSEYFTQVDKELIAEEIQKNTGRKDPVFVEKIEEVGTSKIVVTYKQFQKRKYRVSKDRFVNVEQMVSQEYKIYQPAEYERIQRMKAKQRLYDREEAHKQFKKIEGRLKDSLNAYYIIGYYPSTDSWTVKYEIIEADTTDVFGEQIIEQYIVPKEYIFYKNSYKREQAAEIAAAERKKAEQAAIEEEERQRKKEGTVASYNGRHRGKTHIEFGLMGVFDAPINIPKGTALDVYPALELSVRQRNVDFSLTYERIVRSEYHWSSDPWVVDRYRVQFGDTLSVVYATADEQYDFNPAINMLGIQAEGHYLFWAFRYLLAYTRYRSPRYDERFGYYAVPLGRQNETQFAFRPELSLGIRFEAMNVESGRTSFSRTPESIAETVPPITRRDYEEDFYYSLRLFHNAGATFYYDNKYFLRFKMMNEFHWQPMGKEPLVTFVDSSGRQSEEQMTNVENNSRFWFGIGFLF